MSSWSENFTVAPPLAVFACLATKFLPASKVTLLLEPTFASASEPASVVPPLALVSTTKWFAFNASATAFALTNLPSSAAAGALIVPSAFTKSPAIKFGVNVTVSPALVAVSAVGFADTTFCTALSALDFTSANWPPFTASVLPAATLPLATPVIFLLPALMPSFFTEGPPAMVKPSVFNVLSPAFTDVTLRLSAVLTVYSLPPAALLTSVTSTFLPAFTVVCFAASCATASNWPLFTASFGLTPSATLLIGLLFAFKPSLLM